MAKAMPSDSSMRQSLMKMLETNPPEVFIRTADRTFPLKVGEELFIDGPDALVDEKMRFRFEVVLNES